MVYSAKESGGSTSLHHDVGWSNHTIDRERDGNDSLAFDPPASDPMAKIVRRPEQANYGRRSLSGSLKAIRLMTFPCAGPGWYVMHHHDIDPHDVRL